MRSAPTKKALDRLAVSVWWLVAFGLTLIVIESCGGEESTPKPGATGNDAAAGGAQIQTQP